MNEADDFALVHKPPSALAKTQPGAKRILSGMVADTLALLKQESPSSRKVHVLITGTPEFNEYFPCMVQWDGQLKSHFDFRFHSCVRMDDLSAALKRHKFDLALVQLHRPPPDGHKFADQREVLLRVESLFAENAYVCWAGFEIVSFLHSAHGIPAIMVTDTLGDEKSEALLAVQVGARALFPWRDIVCPAFAGCLRGILQVAAQPLRTRPPRIVVVDDEDGCLELFELLIRHWFTHVELLSFLDSTDTWNELSQTDPDLLIMDIPLVGVELLPLLADRQVKYPILVTSGFYGESDVRRLADPSLRVSFLFKPFSADEFLDFLRANVGPSDNPALATRAP